MSEFWSQCIERIRAATPEGVFQNWFADLTAEVELEADSITIFASSSSKLRLIRQNYESLISDTVKKLAGREFDIVWMVDDSGVPETTVAPKQQLSAEEIFQARLAETGLLPNLTFENMVAGQANQMAYASALQVATSPNPIYNPLFIYGGVGLGKTHLMHAIGNRFLRNNPKAKVLCVSAQQFINEFVDAMRLKVASNGQNDEAIREFESRYSDLDLLLVDDIQSFGKRDGTQTNFFLIFEKMVPHGKQIVMTSDTYPRQLKEFQERLLSRITQGLVVVVEPPEFDMRVQILLQKAERSNLQISHEVAEVIAKKLKSNVRELEGAVQQILAYTRFHGVDASLENVKLALRDVFKQSSMPVTVDNIQAAVADYYGIKAADITSKSRKANLAKARQIAMYLAKELTNKSLPELGSLFGGRDHTTVIYACRKIASERNTDEVLKHDLHMLEQRIKS